MKQPSWALYLGESLMTGHLHSHLSHLNLSWSSSNKRWVRFGTRALQQLDVDAYNTPILSFGETRPTSCQPAGAAGRHEFYATLSSVGPLTRKCESCLECALARLTCSPFSFKSWVSLSQKPWKHFLLKSSFQWSPNSKNYSLVKS